MNFDESKSKILVVDDDVRIAKLVEISLTQLGYKVFLASNGKEGVDIAKKEIPDLIIMDVMMPVMDGLDACKILKEDNATRYIPIMILSAKGHLDDRIYGLEVGADDYFTKPFNIKELITKVESILNKNKERLDANPTTRLPGNFSIEREINKRIKSGEKFAFAYVDLDNFKAYNDKYGFYRGDKIIEFTSNVLMNAIKKVGSQKDFIGHIGGDDFVFITEIERAKPICEYIIKNFDKNIIKFYNEEDIARGYILSRNRQGILMEFPLMSISILVVTNKEREITHPGQLSALEGELKSYVKSLPGSNYIFDKRKNDYIGESYKEKVSIIWLDVQNDDVITTYRELKKEGYQIYFSETSIEAIKLFSRLKPHLVLLGANVPFVEAYNMFNFLNTSPELIRIPVLMISSDSLIAARGDIRNLGTDADYFTKRVNIKDLLFKIYQVVNPQ